MADSDGGSSEDGSLSKSKVSSISFYSLLHIPGCFTSICLACSFTSGISYRKRTRHSECPTCPGEGQRYATKNSFPASFCVTVSHFNAKDSHLLEQVS